jgi:phosphoribosylaminoimidazolecarboxamide formyltransferase/IMP cyclohydrolase
VTRTGGRKRALLSVYDKTGAVDLARELTALGYTLLSTGGTAAALKKAGVAAVEIAHYTGQPEILEGRVKTLHPKVHGGILADLSKESHKSDLKRTGIEPIGLVIVNLYPFREVAARPGARLDEVIEMIDIGGPAMVRAAAKNHRHVGVVVDPSDYPAVLRELKEGGALRDDTRFRLAVKAFAHTASYDAAIRDELGGRLPATTARATGAPPASGAHPGFPQHLLLEGRLLQELRYGENPHQRGALYAGAEDAPGAVAAARQLQGKELSFNNIIDLDAAWRAVNEFPSPAAVIVKHNNPCGVGIGATLKEAFIRARQCDPASAFGGIVAFNRPLDAPAATEAASIFLECLIAPGYDAAARDVLAGKKGLRVMEAGAARELFRGLDVRRVTGGYLVQDWDVASTDMARARVVTQRAPSAEELQALDFAWRVARHVKSNAIVLARADGTLGIGAGQMSRVDSVRLAVMKSLQPTPGAVMASDAFFPFRDGIDEAARAGIAAVAQPGGSVRDSEVIAAADEHGMAMVLTGVRHFRH